MTDAGRGRERILKGVNSRGQQGPGRRSRVSKWGKRKREKVDTGMRNRNPGAGRDMGYRSKTEREGSADTSGGRWWMVATSIYGWSLRGQESCGGEAGEIERVKRHRAVTYEG